MRRPSRWSLLPAAMAALTAFGWLVPQRSGPVAALAVGAPYAFGLAVLALTPLAVVRRDVLLAASVALAAGAGALGYRGVDQVQPTAHAADLTLLTWNLHGEHADRVGLLEALATWQPDVVILQEAPAEAMRAFPAGMEVTHHPEAGTPPGMLLASRVPILERGVVDGPPGTWDVPRVYWMELEAPGGPVVVAGAHLAFPVPLESLPCPYCPSRRDAQLAAVARFLLERGTGRVVLAGDLNLSEREVAYGDIAHLADANSGLTWRPLPMRWLPPVLRPDYVMVGDGLSITSSRTYCAASASDHCPLFVRIRSGAP